MIETTHLLSARQAGPERGRRRRIVFRSRYKFSKLVGEDAVHAHTEGYARSRIAAVKLIHRIEPRALGFDVRFLARQVI
jgi:hypothetical protein